MNVHTLPALTPEDQNACIQLQEIIMSAITQSDGAITFAEFMQLALYTPQYGYYTGGLHKIGMAGDFTTAPTLSPLFGQTLAQQLRPLLHQTAGNIYEFGAGTGTLAIQLLNALENIKNYYIIDISSDLIQRQQHYLKQYAPQHFHKVQYLQTLPQYFDGIILGNEVLDAMPVERIERDSTGQFYQLIVKKENNQFKIDKRILNHAELYDKAQTYFPNLLPYSYRSELHLTQYAFIRSLAEKLQRGAMIFIDYGFDCYEYYHPQRQDGTLIGHHRHHVIHDPFFRVGLCDLTAHINFTDIAQAGVDGGLDLIGYTTQAYFLLNNGILDLLSAQFPDANSADYIQAVTAVQMLTAPHEMGELFKVIAFGKHIDVHWQGFNMGDLCHKL